MTAKPAAANESDRAPSAAELARRYLDLWEENLGLCARDGIAAPAAAGPPPAQPG